MFRAPCSPARRLVIHARQEGRIPPCRGSSRLQAREWSRCRPAPIRHRDRPPLRIPHRGSCLRACRDRGPSPACRRRCIDARPGCRCGRSRTPARAGRPARKCWTARARASLPGAPRRTPVRTLRARLSISIKCMLGNRGRIRLGCDHQRDSAPRQGWYIRRDRSQRHAGRRHAAGRRSRAAPHPRAFREQSTRLPSAAAPKEARWRRSPDDRGVTPGRLQEAFDALRMDGIGDDNVRHEPLFPSAGDANDGDPAIVFPARDKVPSSRKLFQTVTESGPLVYACC